MELHALDQVAERLRLEARHRGVAEFAVNFRGLEFFATFFSHFFKFQIWLEVYFSDPTVVKSQISASRF